MLRSTTSLPGRHPRSQSLLRSNPQDDLYATGLNERVPSGRGLHPAPVDSAPAPGRRPAQRGPRAPLDPRAAAGRQGGAQRSSDRGWAGFVDHPSVTASASPTAPRDHRQFTAVRLRRLRELERGIEPPHATSWCSWVGRPSLPAPATRHGQRAAHVRKQKRGSAVVQSLRGHGSRRREPLVTPALVQRIVRIGAAPRRISKWATRVM